MKLHHSHYGIRIRNTLPISQLDFYSTSGHQIAQNFLGIIDRNQRHGQCRSPNFMSREEVLLFKKSCHFRTRPI